MFMFISSTAIVVLKFYIQNLCILATNIISAEIVCFYGCNGQLSLHRTVDSFLSIVKLERKINSSFESPEGQKARANKTSNTIMIFTLTLSFQKIVCIDLIQVFHYGLEPVGY